MMIKMRFLDDTSVVFSRMMDYHLMGIDEENILGRLLLDDGRSDEFVHHSPEPARPSLLHAILQNRNSDYILFFTSQLDH